MRQGRLAIRAARQGSRIKEVSSEPDNETHIRLEGARPGGGRATGVFGYDDPNVVDLWLAPDWNDEVYEKGDSLIDGHLVLAVTERDAGGAAVEVIVLWPIPDETWPDEMLTIGWARCQVIDAVGSADRSLQLVAVLGD
jgi:hypothetical protein